LSYAPKGCPAIVAAPLLQSWRGPTSASAGARCAVLRAWHRVHRHRRGRRRSGGLEQGPDRRCDRRRSDRALASQLVHAKFEETTSLSRIL